LGEVTTVSALTLPHLAALQERQHLLGFSLLEDIKTKLVRDVTTLVGKVYSGNYDFSSYFRFSDVVVAHLDEDYNHVSAVFSGL
jgi:hypothetical protein